MWDCDTNPTTVDILLMMTLGQYDNVDGGVIYIGHLIRKFLINVLLSTSRRYFVYCRRAIFVQHLALQTFVELTLETDRSF